METTCRPYSSIDSQLSNFQSLFNVENPGNFLTPLDLSEYFIQLDVLKFEWEDWKSTHNYTILDAAYDEKMILCESLFTKILQSVDEQPISKIKSPSEKFKNAFDKAKNPSKMERIFCKLLENPTAFMDSSESYMDAFSFAECNCLNYGRAYTSKRSLMEELIVSFSNENFKNKKDELKIASIGSGKLFQDLIIIGKLITRLEIKKIKLFCFDPSPEKSLAEEMQKMLNKLPGVEIEIEYSNMATLYMGLSHFDLIYAIDHEGLCSRDGSGWHSILDGLRRLAPEGKLFLSGDGGTTNAILGADGVIHNLDSNSNAIKNLSMHPGLKAFQEMREVTLFVTQELFQDNFHIPELVTILDLVSQGNDKKITLFLYGNEDLSSRKKDFRWHVMDGTRYALIIKEVTKGKFKNLIVKYSEKPISENLNAPNSLIINISTDSIEFNGI